MRQRINQHPLINNHNNKLKLAKNNFDRFLWVIENFTQVDLPEEFSKFTFNFQSDYPNKCLDVKSAENFINSPDTNFTNYETVTSLDGLMYLDLISKDVFFEFRILQKLKTLEYNGCIYIDKSLKKYDKTAWEAFWLYFNVMQFGYGKFEIK